MDRRHMLGSLGALLGAACSKLPVPETLHTCQQNDVRGDAVDRKLAAIVAKHAQTTRGRESLLASTRVLLDTRHSCDACERRMQRDMQTILDCLKGDEGDWANFDGSGRMTAQQQAERLRGILATRRLA